MTESTAAARPGVEGSVVGGSLDSAAPTFQGVCVEDSMIDQQRIEEIGRSLSRGAFEHMGIQVTADNVEWLLSTIASLQRERQGYYDEASEGWSKFREAQREVERLKAAPLRQQADRLMQEVSSLEDKLDEANRIYQLTYDVNIQVHEERDQARDEVERLTHANHTMQMTCGDFSNQISQLALERDLARAAVGRLRDRLTLTNAAIEKEYPRMDVFGKAFLIPFVEMNRKALTDTEGEETQADRENPILQGERPHEGE